MPSRTAAAIRVNPRISGFVYAIRNIVAEARKVEASGRKVRYLNIGDPITFGFRTPPHMIEAVERAMRDGHNGYAPSVGILPAREAVAAECLQRGMPMSPDRVVITAGTSEGIELALTALAGPGDEVLIPVPTYPLYTAVLAKIGARAVFYRTDPAKGWLPDIEHVRSLDHARDPGAGRHRSQQPHRRDLFRLTPGARWSISPSEHNFPLLADEVYADLELRWPGRRSRRAQSRGADHHVLVAVQGVSGAGMARRLDGGRGAPRGSTMCSPGSRSWRTDGCAARDRWSTRSSPRSTAIGRTSRCSATRFANARRSPTIG